MNLMDIPLLTLSVLKYNIPNYPDLSEEEIMNYFNTGFDVFSIPDLTNQAEATKLILDTVTNHGFILGVTDYDCDGLNSAAVLHKALSGKSNNYKIIHNKRCNNNGFNPVLIDRIKKIHDDKPISLIITADHGSSCRAAFDELKEYGIKHILLTDHHEIPDNDSPKNSVDVFINAQQYENDPIGLCGAAVVFKVLSCLYKDDPDIYNNFYKPCLPHAAIATVSDLMSLAIPYNRQLVQAGMQIINTDTGLWKDMIDLLNMPIVAGYKNISFTIAPFINTGNRSSEEELFYNILIEEDSNVRRGLIKKGMVINALRKKIKKNIMSTVLSKLEGIATGNSLSLIVKTDMAINGIIASSLGEIYHIPVTCFILNNETGILSGSSRANVDYVSVVDIYNKMAVIDDNLFIAKGGHRGAGGCAIKFENLNRYKELFEQVISDTKKPDTVKNNDFIIDINTKFLTYGIVEELNYAGPYGKDWILPKLRGRFKLMAILHIKGMVILTLMAANRRLFKSTYFYSNNETRDSVNSRVRVGDILTTVFEPQYYRRYNRLTYTLLIHNFT